MARIAAQSSAAADRIVQAAALEIQKASEAARLETEREAADLRVDETKRLLGLHAAHPGGGAAIAITHLPEALGNVKVLTLGEGGLQSVLERMAPDAG